MVFGYMQVPTWLGVGHITVTVKMPATGGLYRFANVTYRGVEIGKVSRVEPTSTGATATLSLKDSPQVPADVQANVRSVSAVGEQYVDLIPRGAGPPFLTDGSVIERDNTTVPLKVGPVLDQLSAFVGSVPKEKLSGLLDESFRAFNGAGYDVGSLLDSGSRIAADADATADRTRVLVQDSAPLLDSQVQSVDDLRTWARSLNAVTGQVVQNDSDLRTILNTGPGTADEVSQTARPGQADTAGSLGEPDNRRRGRCHIQRGAATTAGSAASLHRRIRGAFTDQQSGRLVIGWFLPDERGPAALHGRLPSAVAVAFACRRIGGRHPRRPVLQTAAGLPHRRAWRSQQSVYGSAGEARTDDRDLQQRSAVPTTCDAPACLGALPVRSESCRAGSPSGQQGVHERQHVRTDRRHADATASGSGMRFRSQSRVRFRRQSKARRFRRQSRVRFRPPARMWRRRTMTRAPADTSARTETSTSRATWQNSRRPSAIYYRTSDQIGSDV